jgi:hypothetical protein
MRYFIAFLLSIASALAQEPSRPIMIEADFNCDGRTDLALSDSTLWGNAGGEWGIYLKQDDGRYIYTGSAFFHPLAFHIDKKTDGIGIMTVYHRAGGGDGALVKFEITRGSVKEVSSEAFRPSENDPDSLNYKRYQSLFAVLRDHPLHRIYSEREIVIDGKFAEKRSTEQGAAANP